MRREAVIDAARGIDAGVVSAWLARNWRVAATGVSIHDPRIVLKRITKKENAGSRVSATRVDGPDQSAVDFFPSVDGLRGRVIFAGDLQRGGEHKTKPLKR